MAYDDFSLRLGQAIARRYGVDELKAIWDEAETGAAPPAQAAAQPSAGPRLTRKELMASTTRYARFFEDERAAGRDPLASFNALPRE